MLPGRERLRTLAGLFLVLMAATVILDVVIYGHQREFIYREAEQNLRQELEVVSGFILEASLRGDYATIERFLTEWGAGRTDLVEVEGVSPTGFVLAHYVRPEPPQQRLTLTKEIRRDSRLLLTLRVSRDMDPLNEGLSQLLAWLAAASLFMLVALIAMLWYVITRMALRPMEAEIARRSQAESLLQAHRDRLDEQVRARTAELTESNQRLTHEVAVRTQAEAAVREREQLLNYTVDALRELHRIDIANLPHEEKVQSLLELGRRQFGLAIGILSRIEGSRYTVAAIAAPPDSVFHQGDVIDLAATYCEVTYRYDRPIYFHHASLSEWRSHSAYKTYGFEAYIGAQLVVNGKLTGTLCFVDTSPRDEPFSPSDGELIKLMAQWLAAEIEREQSALERVRLANYDGLTGLANRNLFYERLRHAVALAKRRAARVALLVIDLDGFKHINDTLGNTIGDCLLQEVARRLHPCIREEDTFARIGADEFSLIMENLPHIEVAATLAQKMNEIVAAPFHIDGQEIFTSCTIGIALCPDDTQEYDTLAQRAIAAMYRAKRLGTGRFLFFTEEISRKAQERLRRERGLREALKEGLFELHYQPEVEMISGCVASMEALIRWRHPDEGMVPPGYFIGVAEDTGLIGPIGQWVLLAACRQHREWRDRALQPPPIGVNISARQLHDPNLLQQVTDILDETGTEASELILELTETALLQDLSASCKTLADLRALGAQISVDDFGAGYASLSYLKQLPLDVLKIDQSFVRDLALSSNADAIVEAILQLAHQLGLMTVAEGIETQQQYEFLRQHGCDIAQGYLLSRPVPAMAIPELLDKRGRGQSLYSPPTRH